MSAQDLANRTAELGYPIPRSVIANIETGRKRAITVAELPVLAAALDVSPIQLLVPLGGTEPVELIPGHPDDAWTVYRWFIGELPVDTLGQQRDPSVNQWRDDQWSRRVGLHRRHHSALFTYLAWKPADAGPTDPVGAPAAGQLSTLASIRIELRRAGWWLPPIPDDVAEALAGPLAQLGYRQTPTHELVELPPGVAIPHVSAAPRKTGER